MMIEETPRQSYRVMVVCESVKRFCRVAGSYVCFEGHHYLTYAVDNRSQSGRLWTRTV